MVLYYNNSTSIFPSLKIEESIFAYDNIYEGVCVCANSMVENLK